MLSVWGIYFKREENSAWENGLAVGEFESDTYTILDSRGIPVCWTTGEEFKHTMHGKEPWDIKNKFSLCVVHIPDL